MTRSTIVIGTNRVNLLVRPATAGWRRWCQATCSGPSRGDWRQCARGGRPPPTAPSSSVGAETRWLGTPLAARLLQLTTVGNNIGTCVYTNHVTDEEVRNIVSWNIRRREYLLSAVRSDETAWPCHEVNWPSKRQPSRYSERQEKERQAEKELHRKHKEMDRTWLPWDASGSNGPAKMEWDY